MRLLLTLVIAVNGVLAVLFLTGAMLYWFHGNYDGYEIGIAHTALAIAVLALLLPLRRARQ